MSNTLWDVIIKPFIEHFKDICIDINLSYYQKCGAQNHCLHLHVQIFRN